MSNKKVEHGQIPSKRGKNLLVTSITTLTICGSILQSSPVLVSAAVDEFDQATLQSTDDATQATSVIDSEKTKESSTETSEAEQKNRQPNNMSAETNILVDSSTNELSVEESKEMTKTKETSVQEQQTTQSSDEKTKATDPNVKYSGVRAGICWYIDNDDTLHLGTENFGGSESWSRYQEQIKKIVVESPVKMPAVSDLYFSNMSQLTAFENADLLDMSNVTSMNQLFQWDFKLASIDVSNWNVGKVTSANAMFWDCYNIEKLDVSKWDTKNLKDLSLMFDSTKSLSALDVSNWNVSNAVNMQGMFSSSNVTKLDVSNWNMGNVESTPGMFSYSNLTELDLSKWDTSHITTMQSMFQGASKLQKLDLSNWNVSSVETMKYMFNKMTNLEALNLSNWDVANVDDMEGMFGASTKLKEIDLSTWKNANAGLTDEMFCDLVNLEKLDISSLDMSSSTDKEAMLENLPKLKKLTLGAKTKIDGTNLTEPASEQKWRAVGSGTVDNPAGKELFSSADLMTIYDGSKMADTYVLQSAKPITIHYVDENGDPISGVADSTLKYSDQGNTVGVEYSVTDNILSIPGYHFMNQVYDTKNGLPMLGVLTEDMVTNGGDIYLEYHSIDFSTQIIYPDDTVKKVPNIFEKVMTATEESKYGIDLEKTVFLTKSETSEEKEIGSVADIAKNLGIDFGGKTTIYSTDDFEKLQEVLDKVQSALSNSSAEQKKALRNSVIYTGPYRLDYQLTNKPVSIVGKDLEVAAGEYDSEQKSVPVEKVLEKVLDSSGNEVSTDRVDIVIDDQKVDWNTPGTYSLTLKYEDEETGANLSTTVKITVVAKAITVHYVDENGKEISGVETQKLKYGTGGNSVGKPYSGLENVVTIKGYHFMNQIDESKKGLPLYGTLTTDLVKNGGDIYLQYHSVDYSTQITYPDKSKKAIPDIFEKVASVTENTKYGIDLTKTNVVVKAGTAEENAVGSMLDLATKLGIDFENKEKIFSAADFDKLQDLLNKVQSALSNSSAEQKEALRSSIIYTGPYRLDYQLVENKAAITGFDQTVLVNEFSNDNKLAKDIYIDKVTNALGENVDKSAKEITLDDSKVKWDTVGDYQVILTYTDSISGKVMTTEITVHVKDTAAEIIGHESTLVAGPNQTWKAEDNFDSATDANGKAVDFKDVKVEGKVDPTTPGDYEVTYSYEDTFGNVVTSKVVVHVIASQASVNGHDSTLVAGPNQTWKAEDNFDSATDANGKAVDFKDVKVEGKVDSTKPGDYEVTYSYEDAFGNVVTSKVVVHVIASQASVNGHDSTLVAGPNQTWKAEDNFDSATDETGKAVDFKDVKVEGKVDSTTPGDYEVTYSYEDAFGNVVTKKVTVKVIASQASVNGHDSTLVAGPNQTWKAEDNFDNATNATGGVVSFVEVKVKGEVDPTTPGDYEVTYSYTDEYGNIVSNTVTVHVLQKQADLTSIAAHDSTIVAGPKQTWKAEDNFNTATDMNGDVVSFDEITVKGEADPTTPGNYEVTYSYTSKERKSVSITIIVHVVPSSDSIIAHDSTLVAGPNQTWKAEDNFDSATDANGKAVDFKDVKVEGKVDSTKPGDYEVTYSYEDAFGNVVTSKVVVHVIASQASVNGHDSTLVAGPNQTWKAEDNFDSATDANGKAVDFKDVKVKSEVDPTTPGDYEVTYSYEDAFGNVVSTTIIVHIVGSNVNEPDKEEPTIPVEKPSAPTMSTDEQKEKTTNSGNESSSEKGSKESTVNNKSEDKVFPKTGETHNYSLGFFGGGASLFGLFGLVIRNKRNNKER